MFHGLYLKKLPPIAQHAYFAATGMSIAAWSLGLECITHSSISILATWATISLFKGSKESTIFMYIFQVRTRQGI